MVQDGELNVHFCFLVRSSVKNHKGRTEGGKEKVGRREGGRWGRRRERGTEKGQAGGRKKPTGTENKRRENSTKLWNFRKQMTVVTSHTPARAETEADLSERHAAAWRVMQNYQRPGNPHHQMFSNCE